MLALERNKYTFFNESLMSIKLQYNHSPYMPTKQYVDILWKKIKFYSIFIYNKATVSINNQIKSTYYVNIVKLT